MHFHDIVSEKTDKKQNKRIIMQKKKTFSLQYLYAGAIDSRLYLWRKGKWVDLLLVGGKIA
jgi:hypothetical protein